MVHSGAVEKNLLWRHTFGEPLANRCLISWLSLGGPVVKNLPANTGHAKFDLWVRKIPWRRKWQPTLAFLHWKSHGERSLMGYIQSMGSQKSQTWLSDQTNCTFPVALCADISSSNSHHHPSPRFFTFLLKLYPSWVTEHTHTSWVKMILNREIGMCIKLPQSCLTLCNPMDDSPPGFSVHWILQRQEYWSGLPCPPPGDLPNPGIKPTSPALQADSFPSESPEVWEHTKF